MQGDCFENQRESLLYLMVLIDSHTISKSIENDEKIDDSIFDSITDLDTQNRKQRRDRYLHKYKADYKDGYVRLPAEPLKEPKLLTETEKTTTAAARKSSTEHAKHHKTPKKRVGIFWRKFRGKDKNTKHNEARQRTQTIPKNKEVSSKSSSTKDFRNCSPRNKSKRKNRSLEQRQSEVNFAKRGIFHNRLFGNRERKPVYGNKLETGITPQNMANNRHPPYKVSTITTVQPRPSETNIEKLILSMTSQITHLKDAYGLSMYSSLANYSDNTDMYDTSAGTTSLLSKETATFNPSSMPFIPALSLRAATTTSALTTTKPEPFENDFRVTAQMEQLLNDIKQRAVQMLIEINPSVTDIITNVVTETSFKADPILAHTGMSRPGYLMSNLVPNINNNNEKRTVSPDPPFDPTFELNLNNFTLKSSTESHYLVARSIRENAMTLAHSVEDMLQRELKNIYNKVKNKVSNNCNKAKSTIRETKKSVPFKLTTEKTRPTTTTKTIITTKNNCTSSEKTTKPTSSPRSYRGDQKLKRKHGKKQPQQKHGKKEKQEISNPAPIFDDYMMLNLYEQMLTKTHEDNVRKMLSTADLPMKKRRDICRLSKRNFETLTDIQLKERQLYEDVAMPDYDYVEPSARTSSTGRTLGTPNLLEEIDKPGSMVNLAVTISDTFGSTFNSTSPVSVLTENNIDDTSLVGLSKKISYNDFVNGYRHYLKFQKEQSNQNFSNLVKYQAHRHHSVDDIGKFILNKIPQLPSNRRRRFFDDNDMEYQEITTKSDDSWLRKHFYLFIDKGPPKKFHTSQTVELKSAVTEPDLKLLSSNSNTNSGPKDHVFIKIGNDEHETTKHANDITYMKLDDLTNILNYIQNKQSNMSDYGALTKPRTDNQPSTISLYSNYTGSNFFAKLFKGKRKAPKKVQTTTEYNYQAIDMFTEDVQTRFRRTVTKGDSKITPMVDFINKDLEERTSTVANEFSSDAVDQHSHKETNKFGYVDVDLVPKQTAIVKLRETTSKRSRLKDFFKKFHYNKNKKDKGKKKTKRFCTNKNNYKRRKARFNPLKKLKDIFKGSIEQKHIDTTYPVSNMSDEEIMTSHVDKLQHVKYDEPLSIDEMQHQIPNISDILNYDQLMRELTTTLASHFFKLDESDSNLIYNYKFALNIPTQQNTPQMITKPTATVATTPATTMTTPLTTTTRYIIPSTTPVTMSRLFPPNNVMTVNVKTLKTYPFSYPFQPETPSSVPNSPIIVKNIFKSSPLMTLDDMKLLLNKNKYKLAKTTTEYTTQSTPKSSPLMTLEDMNLYLNKIQYKLEKTPRMYTRQSFRKSTPYGIVKSSPLVTLGNVAIKTKLTRPRQSTRDENLYDRRNLKMHTVQIQSPRHQNQMKKPIEELTIKTKLTRIAKCPIEKWHSKMKHEGSPFVGADYLNFQDKGFRELASALSKRNVLSDNKNMMKTLSTNQPTSDARSRMNRQLANSKYTDYFNDILMWHKDILNLDKVPSPIWKNVLQSMQPEGDSYTTHNMSDLLKDLNEINDVVDGSPLKMKTLMSNISSTVINDTLNDKDEFINIRSVPYNNNDQGIIRSVVMNDRAIATSKDFLIKGEAKYFQYNKPPGEDTQLKANDFITKIDRLNIHQKANEEDSVKRKGYRRSSVSEEVEPAIFVDSTLMAYDDVDSVTESSEVRKLSYRSSNVPEEVEPAIFVDSTLMAYDDDVDSITEGLEVKKLSRNSQKSGKAPKKAPAQSTFSKTNKAPIQYYITPLPMKSNAFNKFLKDHKMDVESVTEPIFELSTFIKTWDEKMKTNNYKFSHSSKENDKLSEPNLEATSKFTTPTKQVTKINNQKSMTDFDLYEQEKQMMKEPKKELIKQNQLPLKNNQLINEFDRDKRYTELNKFSRSYNKPGKPSKKTQENNYYNLFKKKISIFDKKQTQEMPTRQTESTELYNLDPPNKEVEITIINFDDIDKLSSTSKAYETYGYPVTRNDKTNGVAIPQFAEKPETTTETSTKARDYNNQRDHQMHNELLYTDIFREPLPTTPTTKEYTPIDFSKTTEDVNHSGHSAPFERYSKPLHPFDFLRKIQHEKNLDAPKRVHISSHHYHYDIFYNNEQKTTKSPFKELNGSKTVMLADGRRQLKVTKKRSSTIFRKGGAQTKMIKKTDRTGNRKTYGRHATISARTHRHTRHFTRSGCKPKPEGGLMSPDEEETSATPTTVENSLRVSSHRRQVASGEKVTKMIEPTEMTLEKQNSVLQDDTHENDENIKDEEEGFSISFHPDKHHETYNEAGPPYGQPTTTEKTDESDTYEKEHRNIKRELHSQQNTFTAKDVAALEVIVDLMKNTLSYEEKDIASLFNNNNLQQHATKSVSHNDTTNSIQIHIAIPFDFEAGKKRSPLDPVRVRKVFSAKMSTPVDLEYQVHSFEGTIAQTNDAISTKPASQLLNPDEGLSPGMYLLVDNPRNGYALKPVKAKIDLSDLRIRQAGATASLTESKPKETTDMETTSLKSLAKVTLSKDFISAVNKQLIELYENMTRFNSKANINRVARSLWKSHRHKGMEPKADGTKKERRNITKKHTEQKYIKRHIDWEAVKRYFGRDRVCNCKCKPNKAMCRACAASDAVIDELIFEFDNLGSYMRDHCTEIQTFFWMNPSGGQKLRESVSRIDKSLSDYYKRVKGKCQGRTCKTFTTYIDKRQIVKTSKEPKTYAVNNLVSDLRVLAEDLNRTVSLKVCFNNELKEEGEKFLRDINSCIQKKKIDKRSNNPVTIKKKLIKNVYSLDNINVNIICNPEVATTTAYAYFDPNASNVHADSTQKINDHLSFEYDLPEKKHKKRKGLKRIFPRKSKKEKLFTYLVTDFSRKPKVYFKRDVHKVTPLISDGGGAFWYDYIKGSTNEPRIVRESSKQNPKFKISIVQKGSEAKAKVRTLTENKVKNPSESTMYMTIKTTPKNKCREVSDTEATTDYLTQNINQLLQLFGSLQDIEAMNMHSNRSTMFLTHSNETIENETQHGTENKELISKKSTKCVKKVKTKMHYKEKPTKVANLTTPLNSKLPKTTGTTTKKLDSGIPLDSTSPNSTKSTVTITPVDLFSSSSSVNATKLKSSATTDSSLKTGFPLMKENRITQASRKGADDLKSILKDIESVSLKKKNNTTKNRFLEKLKSATMHFFNKTKTSTTHLSTENPTTRIIDRISEIELNRLPVNFGESSPITTHMSPTIVIIDEYANQINSEAVNDFNKHSDGYKNLLLSIIDYEKKKLNDEYRKIAPGEKDEGDIKRSINEIVRGATPKTIASVSEAKLMSPVINDLIEHLNNSCNIEIADTDGGEKTKKPEGFLGKIVNKFGIKVVPSKKACDTRRTSRASQICDIQATLQHVLHLQQTLSPDAFENLVRNISCYKYKNVDHSFYIPYKRTGKRWNWIRNKRSLKLHFNRVKDETEFDDEFNVDFDNDDDDMFEKYVKGDDGIYKIVQRRKRTTSFKALDLGLRNIPPLKPGENELYVMVGDSLYIDCLPDMMIHSDSQFLWRTDRSRMLKYENVEVNGVTVTIRKAEAKNGGSYTCSQDNKILRYVRVNVLAVPAFDVVFLPFYRTEQSCSYDDLKAIDRLGPSMAEITGCGKACTIRIDEPVCLRDRGTNSSLIRSTAVISITPQKVNCSVQCRRDLVSSLVMLCAANTPTLSSAGVVISKDGVNETLRPCRDIIRPVVTHSLRKKDSNGHHAYHKLVLSLAPGKVDVVLMCPAGFYLIPERKICIPCPSNTSASTGDNVCTSCPRGTRSEPGADRCSTIRPQPRRYDWWWYPPCGYVVAFCGVLCSCAACALVSLLVHLATLEPTSNDDGHEEKKRPKSSCSRCCVTAAYMQSPRSRPLSPSRVILARFFKPSLTSSRATDSQETKFELWKEKNTPPPLPPIDFDI